MSKCPDCGNMIKNGVACPSCGYSPGNAQAKDAATGEAGSSQRPGPNHGESKPPRDGSGTVILSRGSPTANEALKEIIARYAKQREAGMVSAAPGDDTSLPSRFGRYQVIAIIGEGAVGIVYLAHDEKIDRNVAIKTLKLDPTLPPQEKKERGERFKREARVAGMLSHPDIVTVYDVGEEEGNPYIVMEYLKGATLSELTSEGPLTTSQSLEITAQVLSALEYAHKNDVVHRDIKPDNIFILKDGTVKVADFGIAQLASTSTMTQAGTIIGTPGYMSPEQVRGERVDWRTDIFSTGVLLYELLTGAPAFEAGSTTGTMYKVVHEEPPPLMSRDPHLPQHLQAVISRALAKSREQRYQGALEMKQDLAAIQVSAGAIAAPPARAEPPTPEAVEKATGVPNTPSTVHVAPTAASPTPGTVTVGPAKPAFPSRRALVTAKRPARPRGQISTSTKVLVGVVSLVVIASIIAVVVLLTSPNGIGEAKEYINNADAIIEEVGENSSEMNAQIDTIFTELAGGEVTSSAKANELAEGLADATDDLISKANEAKLELEKVASLEGVDEYQEYALLRISVIDDITELIQSTEKFLTDLGQVLVAAESGQPVDLAKVESESTAFFTKILELQENIETNGELADELEKEL